MRILPLLVLIACDAGTKPAPPSPPPAPVKVVADAMVIADAAPRNPTPDIVTAALSRFEAKRDTLPDSGLVGTNNYVMFEPGIDLPETLPGKLKAMPLDQLEAIADKTHKMVGMVHVFGVKVQDATHATITIGGDIALEKKDRGHKLCCCNTTDLYELKDGVWTFVRSEGGMCS
ncbi:MAG: hypothetical protein QM831_09675 [Kofleriaceae bacterium]